MKETLALITAAEAASPTQEKPVQVEQLDTAKPLEEIFQPYSTTLTKWKSKVDSLIVTDIGQKTEMAQARLARLELREARVAMDKTRKGLVEHLKARTGKIDAAARTMREQMEALEDRLLESEEFADRHAAKVKAETKVAREKEILPFMDTPIIGDLSDLSPADYATMLSNAKLARQAKIDLAAKNEAEAKAKAEAERLERERIATENARLKAEAVEAAARAETERLRVQAEREGERRKAQADAARLAELARQEKLKVEAEAKAERERLEAAHAEERRAAERELKKAAEEAAKARAQLAAKAKAEAAERARVDSEAKKAAEAARAAAAAPDKAKLVAYAAAIRKVPLPTLSSDATLQDVSLRVLNLCTWIETALGTKEKELL